MITDMPELIHWRITLSIADTESRLTGVRQRVYRDEDGAWRHEPVEAPPVYAVAEFQAYADRHARQRANLDYYRCDKCGASSFTGRCPDCRETP